MSALSEQRITAYHQKTALGLISLIDADIPIRIKLVAVSALARCKVPVAREKVAEFFQGYPLEEDAVAPMGEAGGEIGEQLLIARVRDRFALNRDLVTERLGMFKSATALAELRDLLGDPDRHVRWQAVNGLFAIGGKEAALALCKYISDPDEWISMSILKLLCRMKEHESIPFLAEQFAKETDLRRKAQMVNFLSMFKSVTLVNIFDEGLRSHDARLKANAIEAFSDLELPQREIAARISPYLEDPNNRIRANAILALSRSEPERIRPHLVKMVESDDVQLRRSSAFILGQIASEGNEELAAKLITDSSVDVRKRMVLSLRRFAIPFARGLLEKSVTDEHPWIRKHSIDLAGGYPDFPAAVILKQLKTEVAAPNLVACMDFFSKHPTDEASRLIRLRVKDKREMVVSGVIRAIGAIHGLPGLQQLAPQINYRDPRVLRSFTVTHFGLGGLEIFDSIAEKAVQVKKSQTPVNDQYLSALEGCLDLLNMGPKMPAGLKAELERAAVVQAPPPPPPQPVVTVEPSVAPDPGQIVEAPTEAAPLAVAEVPEVPAVAAISPGSRTFSEYALLGWSPAR